MSAPKTRAPAERSRRWALRLLKRILPSTGEVAPGRPGGADFVYFLLIVQSEAALWQPPFARRSGQAWFATGSRPRTPNRSRGSAGCASRRSEEHTSELQSLMRISYAVFCLKKKK